MLYIFDEPTTGLHFDDVSKLLAAFRRLIEAGGSILVIEHNLDVIKTADWVIDLGPEGGARGGEVVAVGTPEADRQVAEFLHRAAGCCAASYPAQRRMQSTWPLNLDSGTHVAARGVGWASRHRLCRPREQADRSGTIASPRPSEMTAVAGNRPGRGGHAETTITPQPKHCCRKRSPPTRRLSRMV